MGQPDSLPIISADPIEPTVTVLRSQPLQAPSVFLSHTGIFSVAGEVIKHGDLKCVRNEGMPIYKAPLEKGMLIIQFLVSAAFSLSHTINCLAGKARNPMSLCAHLRRSSSLKNTGFLRRSFLSWRFCSPLGRR